MTAPIFSGLIMMVFIFGAYGESFFSGLGWTLIHDREDVEPALPRLLEGGPHDVGRDALDLDVHLERGDAVFGPGDLEVHVAQVVLQADDVAQDRVPVSFHDKPHGDARHGRLEGNARVEQRERRGADRGHGRRAVRLEYLGDLADGVGKILVVGNDVFQGPLGQHAVADLATAHAAVPPGLADGEGREMVMEHEALLAFAFDVVHPLDVVDGAQRRDPEALRLAPGEHGRAVRPGQDAQHDVDGSDILEAATVGALALFEDALAHDFAVHIVDDAARLADGVGEVARRAPSSALSMMASLASSRSFFILYCDEAFDLRHGTGSLISAFELFVRNEGRVSNGRLVHRLVRALPGARRS